MLLLLVGYALATDVPPLGEFIPSIGGSLPVMSTDGRRLAWVGDRIRVSPDGDVPAELTGVPIAWASAAVLVVRGWPSTWTLVDVDNGRSVSLVGVRDVAAASPGRIAILGSPSTTQITGLQAMGLVVDTLEDAHATALIVGDDGIVGAIRRVGRPDYLRADGSYMWPTTAWGRDHAWHLRRPLSTAFVGDFRLLSRAFGRALLALDGQTSGTTTLASIGFGAGESEALFEAPPRGAVAAVLQSPMTGQPLAVGVRAERLAWHALLPEVDRDLRAITAALPDDDWFPSVSSDLAEWLLYTTGPTHGYRAYRYSRATGEVQRVDHFSREARQFRPTTPVTWAAPDGQVVGAYLTTPDPAVFGDGPWPLVVLAHGGPSTGRYEWGWSFDAQRLAALGDAVLAVNYRGSDGFGRDFANADGRDDIAEAIRRQVEAGVADPQRVAMMGSSYGGILTLWTAEAHPGLLRCGVPISADDRLKRVDRPVAPMLMLAGEHDGIVPVGASSATVARLARRGAIGPASSPTGGHSFVVFPDAGHGLPEVGTPAWAIIERFLGVCLDQPSGSWDGLLDGYRIDARVPALPGLDDAVRVRTPGPRSPILVPLVDDGPVLPLADWIPR